jgi:hypothetical protein
VLENALIDLRQLESANLHYTPSEMGLDLIKNILELNLSLICAIFIAYEIQSSKIERPNLLLVPNLN